jgi:hypothetical protein
LIVEFVPDGKPVRVSVQELVDCWRSHCTIIPAQYAAGTAQHETGYAVNEVDTEENGYVSKGIFQLSDEEANSVYHHDADLLDLDESCIVFSAIQVKRMQALVRAAKANGPSPSLWAYLAVAHNQGLAAAVKSIAKYGMDWNKYRMRNLADPNAPTYAYMKKMVAYGDDCISGGDKWTPSLNMV